MRVFTVRQPWAWAIAAGFKTVENRTRNVNYRGRVAIHAGKGWSERGGRDPRVRAAALDYDNAHHLSLAYHYALKHVPAYHGMPPHPFASSMVIATARLTDCHHHVECEGGCGPWGEEEYTQADGRLRTDVYHWRLGDIEPLARPLRATGRLGLWKPDADLLDALGAA